MRAVLLRPAGSQDDFQVAELPVPTPRAGEVLVQLASVSFNPIDVQLRRGRTPSSGLWSPILGRDFSGTIVSMHEGVTDLVVGDEVYGFVCNLGSSGTYTEYVTVPAELVARKPRSLDWDAAAAVPVVGLTARLALDKVVGGRPRSIFIAGGAGGVGTFSLMQAPLLCGAHVVTTAGSPSSHDYLVSQLGLHPSQIVDYRAEGFIARALAANGGHAYDGVLDFVGGGMLALCSRLVGLNGHLATVTESPSVYDLERLFEKNASLHCVGAHASSLVADRTTWLTYRRFLDEMTNLYEGGVLAPLRVANVGPLSIDTVLRAHALLERGGVQGKLVMSICRPGETEAHPPALDGQRWLPRAGRST